MTTTTAGLYRPLARYAETLHAAVGDGHHVASPLGAWLLLALCAPAGTGEDLSRVLGVDVATAGAAAADLLGHRHPLIGAAAGLWHRPVGGRPVPAEWLAALPPEVQTGDLPSQTELDEWAHRHTLGLIDRFPVTLTTDTVLVLASALATRVSWERPFAVVPVAALGPESVFAGQVSRVLRTPRTPQGRGHTQFIADTDRAGEVAVHTAHARDGLLVTSVVAAPDVAARDVLAAGYELAHAIATGETVPRRSLFDLPLGEGTAWTLTERVAPTNAPDGREERCTAVLPAWSARSEFGLDRDELGFPAAASVVGEALGLPRYGYAAKQAAVARYSRVGFAAAAVSGMAMAVAYVMPREGVVREAELRFGHPFAVVAVAVDEGTEPGPWHGLPVFSAWVANAEDAEDAA
jgi:hypothetical protein